MAYIMMIESGCLSNQGEMSREGRRCKPDQQTSETPLPVDGGHRNLVGNSIAKRKLKAYLQLAAVEIACEAFVTK